MVPAPARSAGFVPPPPVADHSHRSGRRPKSHQLTPGRGPGRQTPVRRLLSSAGRAHSAPAPPSPSRSPAGDEAGSRDPRHFRPRLRAAVLPARQVDMAFRRLSACRRARTPLLASPSTGPPSVGVAINNPPLPASSAAARGHLVGTCGPGPALTFHCTSGQPTDNVPLHYHKEHRNGDKAEDGQCHKSGPIGRVLADGLVHLRRVSELSSSYVAGRRR